MRLPTGVSDQYIYFVAVDSTDLKTRKTGLSGFTVYRSRNGGAATAYTTPTINETDSVNMPGVYELLVDEDVTLDAGDQSQEICLHISVATMAPVTRVIELYRPSVTDGERITVSGGAVSTVTTTTTATNVTTVNGLAANVITATSINADAITAAKIADGAIDAATFAAGAITAAVIATGAIDADAIAADAATEIANAVWDTDCTGRQTQGTFGQAIGDPVADTNTIFKAVVTDAAGATVGVDVVAIQADTDNIQTRLPAALVSGRMDSDVAVIQANVITAAAINADAITAAKIADDVSTEIANKVWDTDCTGRQTQGTFGQAIGDPVADTNTIYKAVVSDATGATVGVDVVDLKTQVGVAGAGLTAIDLPDQTMNITGNITGNLSGSVGSVTAGVTVAVGGITSTTFAAGAIDSAAIAADAITSSELAQSAAQEIADEVLDRDLAGGTSGSTRNVRNALRALRNKVSEAAGTLTVTEEDDTTSAWTATVVRSANTNPITSVDPG